MKAPLSENTKTILLLTAPLILGQKKGSGDILSPGEYRQLARFLREIQRQPADLLEDESEELRRACRGIVEEERLNLLLERGFLLSQVVEHWRARAIWVVSRADREYPRRLKIRLRENAPALLYGCGDISLLETGGLGVVGSRHVDDTVITYSQAIGSLTARASRTLISGGARGIDQAAMAGALESGGMACGVLSDSLARKAMQRENRNLILSDQLTLVSPYDPNAGFNVGHAMQRNKLIYALADAALVVNSDYNKGGTWAGAIEQLEKLHLVPVYIRSTGNGSKGLDMLRQKGALLWPDPHTPADLEAILQTASSSEPRTSPQKSFTLFDGVGEAPAGQSFTIKDPFVSRQKKARSTSREKSTTIRIDTGSSHIDNKAVASGSVSEATVPADQLFTTVREVALQVLEKPMNETDFAESLDVSRPQAREWLKRLTSEGLIEKLKKPVRYRCTQSIRAVSDNRHE